MAPVGTRRLYRPDPRRIGVAEQWGRAAGEVTLNADSVVVTLRGEIDASNTLQFACYVERHAAIAHTLVIDTRAVDFFGVPALAGLRKVDLSCRRGRVRWKLVAGPAVKRALRACGADDLPQAESVDGRQRRALLTT
jgi:anti-anti-sigma factor